MPCHFKVAGVTGSSCSYWTAQADVTNYARTPFSWPSCTQKYSSVKQLNAMKTMSHQ